MEVGVVPFRSPVPAPEVPGVLEPVGLPVEPVPGKLVYTKLAVLVKVFPAEAEFVITPEIVIVATPLGFKQLTVVVAVGTE